MKIFSKKNKKPEGSEKMLGVYVPAELHSYYTLRAMVENTSVSDILQQTLPKELERISVKMVIDAASDYIGDILLANSIAPTTEDANTMRATIIETAEAELRAKGISEEIINQIIAQV